MKREQIRIWNKNEYQYPMAWEFLPNIMTYLHDEDEETRPGMIVVPGGGYCVVSPTEGEIVAKKFYEMGYQAFVLTYTTNMLMAAPLKDQPLKDLSRAIRYVRRHAAEFCLDPDRLAICGFSAGGHLCASVCVHYQDVKDADEAYQQFSNRPDAAILSYPVISSGDCAHRDSFKALLGMKVDEKSGETICTASAEELEYMSLEKHVTADTPPCFLWQTADDELVPVENSYLFAQACKEQGVPFTHHVFSHGQHGLSLADEEWASGRFGEFYSIEQIYEIVKAVKDGRISLPEEKKQSLLKQFDGNEEEINLGVRQPNPEARIWPVLAEQWLKIVLKK